MSVEHIAAPAGRQPLRLWPGVVLAVAIVVMRFGVGMAPDGLVYGMFGAIGGAALVALWWLLFSRAAWIERLGAIAATVAAFYALRPLLDQSIAGGMMGMMFAFYAIPPVLAPAFVAWAVATRRLSTGVRRATMVATIF